MAGNDVPGGSFNIADRFIVYVQGGEWREKREKREGWRERVES